MEEKILNILIVEDDQLDAELIQYNLKRFGYTFVSKVVDTRKTYIEALATFNPDIILSDYSMPRFDGMTSLLTRNDICPFTPFIVVTGSTNEETAVVCIKAGASDYVLKDNLKRLGPAVKGALKQSQVQKDKQKLIEELRESENFNRLLVENQIDLISRWDLDFKLTFINKAYCEFYELSREEIIGRSWLNFLPEKSRDATKQYYLKLFKQPIVSTFESEVIVPNGNVFWLEWTDCPLFDENGLLSGFQSSGRDITHKKYLDQQIQNQFNFIRSLFESIPIPVFSKDSELKYMGCNPAFSEMTGISEEILTGKTVYELYDKEQADIYNQADTEMMQSGLNQKYEYKIKDKNGVLRDVVFQKSPLRDSNNNIIGIIGAYFDISERTMMENKLKESEEKYRLITENINDLVWCMDLKLNYVFTSPSIQRFLGYSIEERSSIPTEKLLTPASYKKVIETIKDIVHKIETGVIKDKNYTVKIELEQIRKDGSVFWAESNVGTTFDEHGKIIGIQGVTRDISERKKAEDALKESEERYRIFLNASEDLSFLKDENLKYLLVNKANANFLGKEKKDIIGKTDFELMPTEVANSCKLSDLKAINSKGVVVEEELVNEQFFESRKFPVTLKNGKIGVGGFIKNITELKKAKQHLEEEEERFKLMINNLPVPVSAYNYKDDQVLLINPKFTEIFGYSSNEIKKIDDWFLLSTPDFEKRTKLKKAWKNNFSNRKNREHLNKRTLELTILCKDKSTKAVETTFTIYKNTVFVVFIDITERKQMLNNLENKISIRTRDLALVNDQLQLELYERKKQEERLRFSENLNNTTINAINDYIFVIDANLNVLMYNDAIKQYIRKAYAEKKSTEINIKGKKIDVVFPEFKQEIIKKYDEILANRNGFSDTIEVSRNEKPAFYEIKAIPVVANEKVFQIVTYMHDITQLVQVEEEIKLNLQREKELNLLKTRFISVVSHEFRTPLASIQSSIQLIERYRHKMNEEKIGYLFSGIYETIRYSNILLDDISIIGKDESGRLEINYTKCDIKIICNQCIIDTKALYGENTLINFSINQNIEEVMVDESLLRHVLNNILSNAVKYSDASKAVKFDVDLKAKNIIFTIEDSGRGIPEKDLAQIYEPFHRASNVESVKGTGLGLAIVKRCVELHKGTIVLKSILSKGTTVTIKIPYKKK